MRHILIIGAGKSTGVLIDYLLEKSETEQFKITIADMSLRGCSKNYTRTSKCVLL